MWYPSTSCKACVIEGGFRWHKRSEHHGMMVVNYSNGNFFPVSKFLESSMIHHYQVTTDNKNGNGTFFRGNPLLLGQNYLNTFDRSSVDNFSALLWVSSRLRGRQ